MLVPNKHSHPDGTVLAAATAMLGELRSKRAVGFDELRRALERSTRGSEFLFTPALSLLYLLGLVDYHPTVDSFEYTGQ